MTVGTSDGYELTQGLLHRVVRTADAGGRVTRVRHRACGHAF